RKQKQIEVLDAQPRDPNEGFVKLKGDGQSFYHPIHEQDGMLLMHTNENAPRGKVIAVGTQPPYAEQEIIPQHPTDRFVMLHVSGDTHVAQYNHDGGTRLTVLDKDFKPLRDLQMPEQAIAPTHSISIKGDKLSLTATSFKHASEAITFDLSSGKQTASKVESSPFDLPDAVVERVYATSKDGTRVPMTIIRPKDVEMDGTAAVQLSGYGGFNTVLGPQTNPDINDWVSRGGIYVQANLRGGGEFGKDWYDQGRLHNKQNVFDDFAACAEFLSKQKYTSPERLAIEGTSNGGLLTLATAMQRPELFGAVLSNVPVTDMLTERWPGDYGKAREQRGDFENNMAYSPLHTVKEKVKYPPMMVKTGKLDPTVPASDTYKFVATMQAKSPETLCLMRVDKDVAHNATSIEHTAKQTAEQHAFLETVLGPIDQKQFKAAQKAKEAGTQKESALVPKIDLRALEEVKKISQKVTLNSDLVAAAASHTSFADKVKNAASPKNAGNSR
ncbi:MAG: S9 family peptidase, partial [Alphaproteobacteria bacterium]|nr:S9 family peptidase [Alphaproteobacteria bacterium]